MSEFLSEPAKEAILLLCKELDEVLEVLDDGGAVDKVVGRKILALTEEVKRLVFLQ